jgi:hypothetical protein
MLKHIGSLLALAGVSFASIIILSIPLSTAIAIVVAALFFLAAFRLAGELEKQSNVWFEVAWETFPTAASREPQIGPGGDRLIEMILAVRFLCKTGKYRIERLEVSIMRKRRLRQAAPVQLRMPQIEWREGEGKPNLQRDGLILDGPEKSQPYHIRAYGYLPQQYSLDDNHFIRVTVFALDQEPFSVDLYCDWRLAANRETSLNPSFEYITGRRALRRLDEGLHIEPDANGE